MSKATQTTDRPDYELPNREQWDSWKEVGAAYLDGIPLFSPDAGYISTNRTSIHAKQMGYVPATPDDVLSWVETEELDVPTYYSRFDQFDMHVSELDTSDGNDSAWGLTESYLENALRVVVGGGRYSSDDVGLFALTNHPVYLLVYKDDVWVVSAEGIRHLPDDYEYERTKVHGLTVPDDNEAVLRGMDWFLTLLEREYDETVVAYEKLRGRGKHVFGRPDGTTFSISGVHLRMLGRAVHEPDEVQTEYTIETEYDEQYELSWDDVEKEIGDPAHDYREDGSECVAGYQMRWEDPRTSSRVSMTGKVTARATYYYILQRKNGDRYEVRDTKETIAKFDCENEDYSIF